MKFKSLFLTLAVLPFFTALSAQCGSNRAHARTTSYTNMHHKDVVDVAASNDMFQTLVVAVKTAGLVNTLKGDGPFTVFAPTNAAFAKLPAGTVESLLQPESKDALQGILTYHVVAGEFKASDVIAGIKAAGGTFTIKTVNGGKLKASLSNDTVILTDENGGVSAVTQTDVSASNGVIHVIDTVVLP